MSRPLKGFITYSHEDAEAKDKLRRCLAVMKQQNNLVTWHDGEITAGDEWYEDISSNLAESDILLYLVSAASLGSKNCNKEFAEALNLEMRVIPIILESCDWLNHKLSKFEVLPYKGRSIDKWQPESDGWQNVVAGIRKAVDKMQAQVDSSPETSEKDLRAELAFQQGNVLMMLGQMDKAIEVYSRAIKLNPNYADAYNNRGVTYVEKGNLDHAIEDFNTAIDLKPNYAAYNNRGLAYDKKGEFNRAIEDYTKVIDLNPNYTETYNSRGNAYDKKGEFDKAIEDFNTAILLNPDYANAYSNRGRTHGSKGEFDKAMIDFGKAIKLDPKLAGAYNNRGNVCHHKGEFDKAIEDFNTAIELKPNDVNAYNNRGNAYGHKGEFDKAIEDYNTAILLKPNLAQAYNNRGIIYNDKGEFDRAIEDYSTAIKLKPSYVEAYNHRGVAYDKKGDYDRAIIDYDKVIKLKLDDAGSYNNRGIAYKNKGNFDRAIEDFNTAIELKRDYADAYNNRGNTYKNKEDYNRAIGDYTKAINLKPNYVDAYYNRGLAYGVKGDYDRAIVDFTKVIDLKSNDADAYNSRGMAYGEKGDYDHAIEDYNRAIDLEPDYADAYHNRGVAYHQKGDYDHAIVDYDRAIELKSNYVIAYYSRGVTYGNKGDYDHAVADYDRAIELKPDYTGAYHNRGVAYYQKGDYNRAIEDYNRAIELKPDLAESYIGRGLARLCLREWERAKADLTIAKDKGLDIVASFHSIYESVEAYERANRVKLPGDIAAMLTQRRRSRFPRTQKFLSADGTPLESSDVLNLLAKLRGAGTPLSQYVQTRPTFGIKTDRSGAFVVDAVTRDQLITEHPSSVDILKPFLHGQNIRRWQVARPDSWLIFTYRRIEINRYPAIRKHLEKYRSALSKRTGKQKWYELPATRSDAEHFVQTKLICPNSYDHQTFAVDRDGFYCGDTCYLIPIEETWLCGLLNSRAVEWFYSQASKQLTGDYLRARSRYMQQIPIPNLTSAQKSQIGKIVDYLIFLQGQPTTNSKDLAHARDFIMLRYFERIIDGLVYESYLREELHHGDKQFFKPLLDERLPQIEEIREIRCSHYKRSSSDCMKERIRSGETFSFSIV